mmetsp:Transcript_30268/g.77132  ORF Transcript_30268/g.77132 Transcript_30268/m.77132 type:complete len:271 (-) Transcript_30268:371-1183(-)
MVLLLGLVCSSHALLVPQRAPPKLAQPQTARPKSPLRCPRLSMFEVESSSSTVVACSKRKPADEGVFGQEKVGSLGQYLSELTSAQLATALESRLSHLITASPSPSNPNAVVVALRESFYFGPRILHLWIKPRLVVHLTKQAYPAPSIQCASTCETDADFSERLRLAQLELNCWCTWWEEGLPHLQGNAVPCLLLNSRLRLNFQQLRRTGSSWLLRAIPMALLCELGRRAMQKRLATLEDAVARALVGGYEEWTVRRALPYVDDFYDACP